MHPTGRLKLIRNLISSVLVALLACLMDPGSAADLAGSNKPTEERPQPLAPAIPLANLAEEADAAAASLRNLTADDRLQGEIASIENELPSLGREVDARWRENKGILAQRPPLELLRNLDTRWQEVRTNLADLSTRLKGVISSLDDGLETIDSLEKNWLSHTARAREEKAPPELLRRSEALLAEIAKARSHIQAQRTQALKLQTRISDVELRVTEALESNRKARDEALQNMFSLDSAAFWEPTWRMDASARILAGAGDALRAQGYILRSYVRMHLPRFALHAALLATLTAVFYWVRRRLRSMIAKEPGLEQAAAVVEFPFASALVLALMLTHWIYSEPPRLMLAMNGIAIFVPTVFVLRRLVSPSLLPPLYAALALYFVDPVRAVSASVAMVPRLLFASEMACAAVFLLWYIRQCRRDVERGFRASHIGILRSAAWLAFLICIVSVLANVTGYVALSNLMGDTVLKSLYAGLVLYTVVRILDALIELLMRAGPLTRLRMVRVHGALLQRRFTAAVQWAAILVWMLHVLNLLSARDAVASGITSFLRATVSIGAMELSPSRVLSFIAAIWAAFIISRFIRFLLNEEIFPHASMKRGIPYAISRIIHFVIVTLGFIIAMGVIGMQMTQLTILASAFTIGVGFGLQNIFNNFVSGLIVLFERPVQVGDVIQIDDAVGSVDRIGIRASVVRTASGSEIIIPNGKLISDRVVNWTLSGHRRVIEVSLSVNLQSDPAQVIAVLEQAARQHPAVAKQYPVQALVTRLGPDWMGFELRVTIDDIERWTTVRSELAIAATTALRAANIALR